jgi:transcriptional regulator with XRE-family HTH domain
MAGRSMSTSVPTNADLGRALRGLRRSRRLTIEELAHTAQMHPTYLSGIERGIRNPTWVKLAKLAQALDVPISTIAHDAETEAQVADRMRAVRSELGVAG